jgi:hypothetical protein
MLNYQRVVDKYGDRENSVAIQITKRAFTDFNRENW